MDVAAGPAGVGNVPAVPHGDTALRLTWKFLPPEVRALVEDELGSPVASAVSCDGGFTPGFASVLTGENGRQVFLKAASTVAQAEIAAAYAAEIRKVSVLADLVPAPRLEWFSSSGPWVLLGYEAVPSRPPRRPWRRAELDRALDLAERIALPASDLPEDLALTPLVADVPTLVTGWESVPEGWPHRDEAAALARRLLDLPATHLVHADLRDDNVLLADDGRTLACDWNWPALGTPWQDAVDLLVAAHGDGADVEAILRARPQLAGADPEDVDSWLAGMAGYMLDACQRPERPSSPHLRTHGRWYAEAAWSWLALRRGWAG